MDDMSADNFYLIRPTADGKFSAAMGFMSNEFDPPIEDSDGTFDTMEEAIRWASGQYSEYGVRIGSCLGSPPPAGGAAPETDTYPLGPCGDGTDCRNPADGDDGLCR